MKFIITLLTLLLSQPFFAQVAEKYFPKDLGVKLSYSIVPLNSENEPMLEYKMVEVDSFVAENKFFGKKAKLMLTKIGYADDITNIPFPDSTFINFERDVTSKFLSLQTLIDTNLVTGFLKSPKFVQTLDELDGWYPIYQFAKDMNSKYLLFQKDTLIVVDSVEYPIRLESIGVRKNDENISTAIGNFNCKKFVFSFTLSYLLTVSPLPTVPVPLLTIPDTTWIAEDNWIVKEVVPTTILDLTRIGKETYSIMGYQKLATSELTDVHDSRNRTNLQYELGQNYPNPFNPTTMISYTIPTTSKVKIEIFNSLGQKVSELVNKTQTTGNHSANWNATNFSSGTYFARLTVTSLNSKEIFSEVKKMLLLK